ncbi:MAG TPA: lactate utilization protein LutB domain-containing protein, partial [Thermomicrobiaceae bacterium]|nr:lactate utilization protein LutB domain-containing protein [Thermomicrobiaceae bacterium]
LCGACYEVCPVRINIPEVLVHLRGRVVRAKQAKGGAARSGDVERAGLELLAKVFQSRPSYEQAQRLARIGQGPFVQDGTIRWLPGELAGWTESRDLSKLPDQTFREWWKERANRDES